LIETNAKPYLRLRQICLVAPALQTAAESIGRIFGIPECHRDKGVEKFGLENVLFAFGNSFIEVVAPLRDGTAAGRFLQRSSGNGGYMAIFDCDDPERRKERALALGVRIAHEMDYPNFRGVQLHPADCRATMLEFDHTSNGEAIDGPYYPAGPHWQQARRPDRVLGIKSIDVESHDTAGIARHWSALMDVPVDVDVDGTAMLQLDFGAIRFVSAPPGTAERLAAINVVVPDPSAVMRAAAAEACRATEVGFQLCGVRFIPVAAPLSGNLSIEEASRGTGSTGQNPGNAGIN
jgi:hypothetical protein